MTANQSTATDSEAKVLTLRQVAEVAVKILPQQTQTLQQLLSQPQGLDLEFSRFVLDSRQLSGASDKESTAPAAFVLLKSHTQPIEKSQQYAKAASTQAAFILTEIETEALGYDAQNVDYACPVLYVANLRDILGSLIQLSLLPAGTLSTLSSVDDILSVLPQVIAGDWHQW